MMRQRLVSLVRTLRRLLAGGAAALLRVARAAGKRLQALRRPGFSIRVRIHGGPAAERGMMARAVRRAGCDLATLLALRYRGLTVIITRTPGHHPAGAAPISVQALEQLHPSGDRLWLLIGETVEVAPVSRDRLVATVVSVLGQLVSAPPLPDPTPVPPPAPLTPRPHRVTGQAPSQPAAEPTLLASRPAVPPPSDPTSPTATPRRPGTPPSPRGSAGPSAPTGTPIREQVRLVIDGLPVIHLMTGPPLPGATAPRTPTGEVTPCDQA